MTDASIFYKPLLYRRLIKKELVELKKRNFKNTYENLPYYDLEKNIVTPFNINIKDLKNTQLPKINLYTNYGIINIIFPINYPFSSPIIKFSRSLKYNKDYKLILKCLHKILPKDVISIIKNKLDYEFDVDFKKSMYNIFNNNINHWIPKYSKEILFNWIPAYSLEKILETILSINKYLPKNKHLIIISNP